MRRTAIAEGLADMPPSLQWLRQSFAAFYSGDVVLYFQRDGDTYHVISEIDTVQGDAASGIFFNAGLQRAFNKLRAEYPEALLAKYADDVNGAVVGTHAADGTALRVDISEDRAFIGAEYSYPTPLSYDPLDINPAPTSVPCHSLL